MSPHPHERQERQVFLITGGGTGIGAATARRLARDGASVVICGRRPQPLGAVAEEVGGLAVVADIADPDSASDVVAQTLNAYGRLDGVVLNAGVVRVGRIGDLSPFDWDATMASNLTGAFLVFRAAADALVESRGAVVSVASLAGIRSSPQLGAYSASKAGLIALTQAITVDYGKDGIRANAICPGWVRTPMADEDVKPLANGDVEAGYALATALVPQGRAADSS